MQFKVLLATAFSILAGTAAAEWCTQGTIYCGFELDGHGYHDALYKALADAGHSEQPNNPDNWYFHSTFTCNGDSTLKFDNWCGGFSCQPANSDRCGHGRDSCCGTPQAF